MPYSRQTSALRQHPVRQHPSARLPRLFAAICALGLALLQPGSAHAEPVAADNMVKQLITQVSTDLDQLYQAKRISDKAAVEALIRSDIIPSIDADRLTRRVFRQYWTQIEKAGRAADARDRVLQSLTRTYALALSNYSGDTLSLVSVAPRGNGSIAKTRLRRPTGELIQIDLNLAPVADRWLINDMAVDGIVVSLTFFNAIKPVFDEQGLNAALDTLADVDANQKADKQKTKTDAK